MRSPLRHWELFRAAFAHQAEASRCTSLWGNREAQDTSYSASNNRWSSYRLFGNEEEFVHLRGCRSSGAASRSSLLKEVAASSALARLRGLALTPSGTCLAHGQCCLVLDGLSHEVSCTPQHPYHTLLKPKGMGLGPVLYTHIRTTPITTLLHVKGCSRCKCSIFRLSLGRAAITEAGPARRRDRRGDGRMLLSCDVPGHWCPSQLRSKPISSWVSRRSLFTGGENVFQFVIRRPVLLLI